MQTNKKMRRINWVFSIAVLMAMQACEKCELLETTSTTVGTNCNEKST